MRFAIVLGLLILSCAGVRSELRAGMPFGDGMVLQRNLSVPVWGTAETGAAVTVSFRDQTKSATADAAGKWMVRLDPLSLGDAATLTIRSGNEELKFGDVLVGDVWIGAGQSNMQNPVSLYLATDKVLAAAANEGDAKIRLFQVSDGKPTGWHEATSKTIRQFPAILFFFGHTLEKQLNVPLGLVGTAQGGTSTIQWLDESAYKTNGECHSVIIRFAKNYSLSGQQELYQSALANWNQHPVGEQPSPPRTPGDIRRDMKVGEHFQANIAPLIPMAIKGILWDQGESGTGVFGLDTFTATKAVFTDWRTRWGTEMPILYMQKPSGGGLKSTDAKVAELPNKPPKLKNGTEREYYLRLLTVPKTAMIITSDLGEGIHPTDKSDYGARSALVARQFVYDEPVESSGPIYRFSKVEEGKIRLGFDHVGQGLVAVGSPTLQGFAIAGEDGKFHWAEATIEGDTVVVASEEVKSPVAVRYGWSDTPDWANLFNKDGLPAAPFRTDAWTDK